MLCVVMSVVYGIAENLKSDGKKAAIKRKEKMQKSDGKQMVTSKCQKLYDDFLEVGYREESWKVLVLYSSQFQV